MIKYITDHELVLEAVSDPKFDQYGVVIIDEVRERKLNTDLLLGLVKRIAKSWEGNIYIHI